METNHSLNRGQMIIGGVLVGSGVLFLLGNLFNIDIGALCWPIALIALGVLLVMRPRMAAPGVGVEFHLLGDLDRRGTWTVANEELWLGVADVDLDLTDAIIPPGETVLRIYSFVSDVSIRVPKSVGVRVTANGFLLDTDILGREHDGFFTPIEVASEGYASAERRVRIEKLAFVNNLKVLHI